MNTIIRRAIHADAEGIIRVHSESIRSICSKDYTVEQIEAWAGRKFKSSSWHQAMDRDFVWVIVLNEEVKGFGHFAVMDQDSGEVMGLYLSPEITGQGLAMKMVVEFVKVAREQGLKKISLYSTITAKTFYEKLGFMQSASDTTIEMQGVPIHCYPMELEV